MNIFLPGASGFVGDRVLEVLMNAGHSITALAHDSLSRAQIQKRHPAVNIVLGNVGTSSDMAGIVPKQTEAILYLPGLLREFPKKGVTYQAVHVDGVRNLMAEATRVGATRWIQMSALGAGPNAPGKYFETKWMAETIVRESKLDWTILRPSVIFDDRPTKRLNFVSQLADVARTSPVLPVFGDGKYRMQPVSLDDVAETFVQALDKQTTICQTYELAGPEVLEYQMIFDIIARALGKKRPIVHIPFGIIEPVTALLDSFGFYPITSEQLIMLKNENIVDEPALFYNWKKEFALQMKHFVPSVQRQLATHQ